MDFESVLSIAPVIGVGIGLAIFFARQRRNSSVLGEKIRAELASAKPNAIVLPELVTRVGLQDGFLSRGKVMNVLNPLVASGEVVQEEPPGTTIQNRLKVLRFRIRDRAS